MEKNPSLTLAQTLKPLLEEKISEIEGRLSDLGKQKGKIITYLSGCSEDCPCHYVG